MICYGIIYNLKNENKKKKPIYNRFLLRLKQDYITVN